MSSNHQPARVLKIAYMNVQILAGNYGGLSLQIQSQTGRGNTVSKT